MFSKMLKLTMVLLVLLAFFVVPVGVLSNYSSPQLNKKCGNPKESDIKPKAGVKACSSYNKDDCDGASSEYDPVKAPGCTVDAPMEETPDYYTWHYCAEKWGKLSYGTVDCEYDTTSKVCGKDEDTWATKDEDVVEECIETEETSLRQ